MRGTVEGIIIEREVVLDIVQRKKKESERAEKEIEKGERERN